jgi:outer membrane cobalamin receptor
VSKILYAALLGAAPVGLRLCSALALAQSATSLPPLDVQTRSHAQASHSVERKRGGGSGEDGENSGGDGGSGWSAGPGGGRADLAPDSTANAYRVAPSSRQHTQTFTRKDIEDIHPANVYDLLSHATGVTVTHKGRKFPFSLNIRGDSNFGFIIDGAYVPGFIAGRILQSLPVSSIEQADVVRDGTALTLGPLVNFSSASGALNSGFVVIRTRTPTKTEAEARVGVETYGGVKTSVFAGSTFERDGWTGYLAGLGSYQTADGPDGYNMWSENRTGFGKAGVGFGGFFTETMIYKDHSRWGFERAKEGESKASLVSQKWSYDPIDTTLVASNSRMEWNAANTTLLTMSVHEVQQSNILASYVSPAVKVNDERDSMHTLNLRHSLRFGGTLLQAGAQYVHWRTPTGELFYTGYEREEETLSGYANAEQKLFGDRVTIDGSARVDDHTVITGVDLYDRGQGPGGGNYACYYDKELPLAISYATGASVLLIPQLLATGRYSHTEQGGITGIVPAPGETLDPETQEKYEVGLEGRFSKYITPTLTYFDTSVANDKTPVSYVTDPVTEYSVAQWGQSDTHRTGFELALKGALSGAGWPGKTSYSAAWTHMASLESSTDAYYPFAKPRDLVNLKLTEEFGPWFASASLNYVSEYLSNFNSSDNGHHKVGNFTAVDLSFGRTLRIGDNDARLTLFGRNVTDEHYETVYGYPAAGAVYGAELAVKY